MLGLVAMVTTSCEDWLTLYPTDRVVEENFWEDKSDLEAVRYGAYKQMASTVRSLAVWGDLRSDSYNLNTPSHNDKKKYDEYDEIMKGLLDSSMTTFEWSGLYTTINYCNKVLQHGPEVLANDKQFTTTEWNYIKAEMTALRALNYFYLIRAFKDVPYSTAVINKDSEVQRIPLSNQLDILDSIILDCESVRGLARNRFSSNSDSKGLITNCAIYAMLADMYLWRASLREGRFGVSATDDFVTPRCILSGSHSVKFDYEVAMAYADEALKSLQKQTEDSYNGYNVSRVQTENHGLDNCNLIRNRCDGVSQSTTPFLTSQYNVYVLGNSVESMFELQFSAADDRKNDYVNSLYGNNTGTHLKVCEDALGECYGGWGTDLCKYDMRAWYGAQNLITKSSSGSRPTSTAGYYCIKYNLNTCVFDGIQESRELKYMISTTSSYRNWIIYSMADVMLIKAEAGACLGTADGCKAAREICRALRYRSYCNFNDETKNVEQLNAADASKVAYCTPIPNASGTNRNTHIEMVMNERQIELLGEGKRWFDLVRYAERNSDSSKEEPDERESTDERYVGNGQTGVFAMADKYLKNAYQSYYTTLKNRFKNRYGLYCPIYYKEVDASYGAIQQNPVWNHSKYAQ